MSYNLAGLHFGFNLWRSLSVSWTYGTATTWGSSGVVLWFWPLRVELRGGGVDAIREVA
jgi:hypothetical protein